jgi:hypothetical protein
MSNFDRFFSVDVLGLVCRWVPTKTFSFRVLVTLPQSFGIFEAAEPPRLLLATNQTLMLYSA